MTITKGRFEWDEEKNQENIRKHGISFEDILPIFDDPLFYEEYDEVHTTLNEVRFFGIGMLNGILTVAVSYAERSRTRLISGRKATAEERRKYYDRITKEN